jgi:serine/threonine protein kinase
MPIKYWIADVSAIEVLFLLPTEHLFMSSREREAYIVSSDSMFLKKGELFAERYRPVRLLGKGGMGEVYLVQDSMLDDEEVALKLLKKDFITDEKHIARFLREVKLARQVTHPSVVRTYDVGDRDGILYLTMEYVVGESIKDAMKREGNFSYETVARLLIPLCEGLSAIHSHDIIHRDLKPANILITNNDLVKITDFGIARPGASDLTHHDEIVGSTHYLAPEIWLGKELSSATDIYALGVVAYEMLTGCPTFDAENPAELMWKHLDVQPLPPSDLEPSVALWMDELVLSLLTKDVDQRPCNAMEIASYLERALAQDEVRGTCDILAPTEEVAVANPEEVAEFSVRGPVVDAPHADLIADRMSTEIAPTLDPEELREVELESPSETLIKDKSPIISFWEGARDAIIRVFVASGVLFLCAVITFGVGPTFVQWCQKAVLSSTESRVAMENMRGFGHLFLFAPIMVAPLFLIYSQHDRISDGLLSALGSFAGYYFVVLVWWIVLGVDGKSVSLGFFFESEFEAILSLPALSLFEPLRQIVRGEFREGIFLLVIGFGHIFLVSSALAQTPLFLRKTFRRRRLWYAVLRVFVLSLILSLFHLLATLGVPFGKEDIVFRLGISTYELNRSFLVVLVSSVLFSILTVLSLPNKRSRER